MACVDLVQFIVDENLEPLIVYLAEKHLSQIGEIDYVSTFTHLKEKYLDLKSSSHQPESPPVIWRDSNVAERDEQSMASPARGFTFCHTPPRTPDGMRHRTPMPKKKNLFHCESSQSEVISIVFHGDSLITAKARKECEDLTANK